MAPACSSLGWIAGGSRGLARCGRRWMRLTARGGVPAAHAGHGTGGREAAEVSPRFPPTLFSIPFGLAGLGQVWQAARSVLSVPAAVAGAISIAAAAVWVFLVARYLAQGSRQVLADLRDRCLPRFSVCRRSPQ